MLGETGLVIVDLCKAETYQQNHIPGAVHLDYAMLVAGTKPAPGLLPSLEQLNSITRTLGINEDSRVIAYDNEGGGRSGRLLWTLHVMGFYRVSVINGGLQAWSNEGYPAEQASNSPRGNGNFQVSSIENSAALALKEYVVEQVDNSDSSFFDARTPEEFAGSKAFSQRGGHIPGAINLNWTDCIDQSNHMRLKSNQQLTELLNQLGFSRDKEIITYCQTHHRSSHSYMMLLHLGYPRVRGYAGAWSEWGNDPELPVATGPNP